MVEEISIKGHLDKEIRTINPNIYEQFAIISVTVYMRDFGSVPILKFQILKEFG